MRFGRMGGCGYRSVRVRGAFSDLIATGVEFVSVFEFPDAACQTRTSSPSWPKCLRLRRRLRRPTAGGQRIFRSDGEVFGEAGKHARSAVGMAGLPGNSPIEVEMIVEFE